MHFQYLVFYLFPLTWVTKRWCWPLQSSSVISKQIAQSWLK